MQERGRAIRIRNRLPVGGATNRVLAENIRKLAMARFPSEPNVPKKLSALTGMSASQVQRIMKCELSTSIDNVERLAVALGVLSHQLLDPNLLADQE